MNKTPHAIALQPRNAIALKEWAVVCQALEAGRQVVLLRKGGIDEGERGFRVEHRQFWLFPTNFHQAADEIVAAARPLLDQAAADRPPSGTVRIGHYALVEKVIRIEAEQQLEGLRGAHILADSAVARRFHYREPGLNLLAVRVFRLPRPLEIADEPRFAGCRSWVELSQPLPTEGLEPVLDEEAFARRLGEAGLRD